MTRDRCPSCGAWLILAEVECVRPELRRYPDVASRAVYECPGCYGVFETWLHEDDQLVELSATGRALRKRLSARGPAERA